MEAKAYSREDLLLLSESPLVSPPEGMPALAHWFKDELASPTAALQAPQSNQPRGHERTRTSKPVEGQDSRTAWGRAREEGRGNAWTSTSARNQDGAFGRTTREQGSTRLNERIRTDQAQAHQQRERVQWDNPGDAPSSWLQGNKKTTTSGEPSSEDGLDSIQRFKQMMKEREQQQLPTASSQQPDQEQPSVRSTSVFDDLLAAKPKETKNPSALPEEGTSNDTNSKASARTESSSRFARFFDASKSNLPSNDSSPAAPSSDAQSTNDKSPLPPIPSVKSEHVARPPLSQEQESMTRLLGMFQVAGQKLKSNPGSKSASPAPQPRSNSSHASPATEEQNPLLARLFAAASSPPPERPEAQLSFPPMNMAHGSPPLPMPPHHQPGPFPAHVNGPPHPFPMAVPPFARHPLTGHPMPPGPPPFFGPPPFPPFGQPPAFFGPQPPFGPPIPNVHQQGLHGAQHAQQSSAQDAPPRRSP